MKNKYKIKSIVANKTGIKFMIFILIFVLYMIFHYGSELVLIQRNRFRNHSGLTFTTQENAYVQKYLLYKSRPETTLHQWMYITYKNRKQVTIMSKLLFSTIL